MSSSNILSVETALSRPRHLYINGKHQPVADKGRSWPSINPATGKSLADIHPASTAEVDSAVASAVAAFPAWSQTLPAERARVLRKAAELIQKNSHLFAIVDTHDNGRPYSETSSVDIPSAVEVLEYCAGFIGGGGLSGRMVKLRPDAWFKETKEPLGACAAIGAWNYPLQIAVWKSAPCLAAGNTLVYKPSEFTSLHADLLAAVYEQAGLPKGVFNVVNGAGDVGAHLVSHPAIRKVSFTGQVSTGQKVAAAAGMGMKYVTAELGGKSPLIILSDCDVDFAVDGAMMANFYSTGQVCTNGTRVFVPKSMLPEFERKLVKKMDDIVIGDPTDMNTTMGPMANEQQLVKVREYISSAIQEGAKLLYGGPQRDATIVKSLPDDFQAGFWIAPTIFTNCQDDMRIVKEEIFGPVMSILTYEDRNIDSVVDRANAVDLGLAAGVFGRDINLAHSVVARLEAGISWINGWGESPAEMAVGGWKMSGVGVENGNRGIEAWTQNKSTLVDLSGAIPTVFNGHKL